MTEPTSEAANPTNMAAFQGLLADERGMSLPPWVKALSKIEPYARATEDPETKTTVIRIYGPIGGWRGIKAKQIADLLDKAEGERILVRLNSPGGVAFEGMAIYNVLKSDGRVDTQVDGVAASAGALIFMAGSKRYIPKRGANIMVHRAETFNFAWGNSEDIMREVTKRINALNAIDTEQRAVLTSVTGLADEKAEKILAASTWYGPAGALAAKIATDYVPEKSADKKKKKSGDDKMTATAEFEELMVAWGYSMPDEDSAAEPRAATDTPQPESIQHDGPGENAIAGSFASVMLDAYRRDILED